jgi:hypothetical protein
MPSGRQPRRSPLAASLMLPSRTRGWRSRPLLLAEIGLHHGGVGAQAGGAARCRIVPDCST